MTDRMVQLNPAFTFTCEDCGRDSFVRSVPIEDPEIQEIGKAQFKEMLEASGTLDPDNEWDGELMMAPTTVVCSHCNQPYQVFSEETNLLDDFDDEFADEDDDEFDEELEDLDDDDLEDIDEDFGDDDDEDEDY